MRLSTILCSLTLLWPSVLRAEPSDHPELEHAEVEIIRAFYYISTSRPEYAIDIAVRILQEDPGIIGAHRAYIFGLLEMREADRVVSLYEDWHTQSPDDEVRRTALAWAWMARQTDTGPWCDKVDSLTQTTPENPSAAYWILRARYEGSKDCYFEGEASRLALLELGTRVEEAWGYRLRLLLAETSEIDETLSAEILSFGTAFPNRIAYIPNLWATRFEGRGLETSREGMIELARTGAQSTDPVELNEASLILGRADLNDEQTAAKERLDELDPGSSVRETVQTTGNRGFLNTRPDERSSEQQEQVADLVAAHQKRELLRALRTLDSDLPRTGAARADWHEAKAAAEDVLGRADEALESRRKAWVAEPADSMDKGVLANRYAWSAAVQDKDLERALEAIDSALRALPAWDPLDPQFRGRGYEDWLESQRHRTGAWLDTRGWILYRLGRLEDALSSLQEAVLMRPVPDAEIILHLGIVHAALEHPDEALHLISRGLSIPPASDPLAIEAREIAEKLFVNRRWAGSGLDSWIAAHEPVTDTRSEETEDLDSYRIGKAFPDLEIEVDGKPARLSDFEGIRVVDIWASWCGPCLASLPHINEVAEHYADQGITVIAVSVDREIQSTKKPLRELDKVHFVSGWSGPRGMDLAHIRGIPSVFVIDSNMEIIAYIRGYSTNDTRVDDVLDALLKPNKEQTEERP
jgi:thiol-disulfide isomerase/thioredoxin